MENGPLHDDQLFRAINDRLSNYEAPQEGANWDAMSRSLDQLPKNTRMAFKWKPSLNSILIGLGIVGVSLLGLAFVGGKNGKENNTASMNIPVVQVKNNVTVPAAPVQNVVMNTTTNVTAPVTGNTASVPADNAAMTGINHAATGSFHRHGTDGDANGLRFGDQIDPRKGFIYQTQESTSLVGSHTDSIPSTYYDMAGGQRKTIHLDTAQHHKTKTNSDASTTASGSAAPTGQDITGFDMQQN